MASFLPMPIIATWVVLVVAPTPAFQLVFE